MKTLLFVTLTVLAAGAAHAADGEGKVVDKTSPDYVRCVRIAETGSLVKKQKVCRTNAEWKRQQEQEKADADNLIERSRAGMNPSG